MATTQPTKEQWGKIEKALTRLYSSVIMQIDGFKVNMGLRQLSTYKNGVVVLLNNELKGEWFTDESPERTKFYRPVVHNMWTRKTQIAAVKRYGKREAKKQGYLDQRTGYSFFWGSFPRLKAHLIKNNENIELVKIS